MKITEEKRDLFTVPNDYYLAHCVSADLALGKGIAKEFDNRYDIRRRLRETYPSPKVGEALIARHIFNLVTKEKYWGKPTYDTMWLALRSMRDHIDTLKIKKLAMPLIGCGLDGLQWPKVKELIEMVFISNDIEILICIK